jgi:hypothetical protein
VHRCRRWTTAERISESNPAEEAVKTGVSMIPGVGPVVEKTASVTQLVRDAARERRSWTAPIFKLANRAT